MKRYLVKHSCRSAILGNQYIFLVLETSSSTLKCLARVLLHRFTVKPNLCWQFNSLSFIRIVLKTILEFKHLVRDTRSNILCTWCLLSSIQNKLLVVLSYFLRVNIVFTYCRYLDPAALLEQIEESKAIKRAKTAQRRGANHQTANLTDWCRITVPWRW